MLNRIGDRPHRALLGADALFQAAVIRAIYDVADSGRPIVVCRDEFAGVPI